jgi:hypothetical protein
MVKRILPISLVVMMLLGAGGLWWLESTRAASAKKQIVGAWIVRFPDAPFKYHMMTFHADGTLEQANPDAGNAHTSDSDGMGVWEIRGGKVFGKFVEITADRETRAFTARGEISFNFEVTADRFAGQAVGKFFDLDEKLTFGPINTAMDGTRVKL